MLVSLTTNMWKLFEQTRLMWKRWNSTSIVFAINLLQKKIKIKIKEKYFHSHGRCRNSVLQNTSPEISMNGSSEYAVTFYELWGTANTASVIGWCYYLKTFSCWAKPCIHVDIINMKPKVWALSLSCYLLDSLSHESKWGKCNTILQSTSSARRHDTFRWRLSSFFCKSALSTSDATKN